MADIAAADRGNQRPVTPTGGCVVMKVGNT
jgi:hypothetical protein